MRLNNNLLPLLFTLVGLAEFFSSWFLFWREGWVGRSLYHMEQKDENDEAILNYLLQAN